MRLLLALLLVCLGAVANEPCAVGAEGGVVDGRYVRVQGKVPAHWLDTAAELGDALFERMKADFGRAPDKSELPLDLTLYPTREAFTRALPLHTLRTKRGTKDAHLGGWTQWTPCRSHVFLQRHAFDTRRLVLHELAHQFYARARPASRRGTETSWYREGLAEWYGWHRRTRAGVVFGTFTVATNSRQVGPIPGFVKREAWDAFAFGVGDVAASYRDATALVAALRGTRNKLLRDRFATFEAAVFARGGGAATFRSLFEEHREALQEAVEAYWSRLEDRLWLGSGGSWDERDGVLEVHAPHVAVGSQLWLIGSWRRIEVDIEVGKEAGARAGISFTGARGEDADLALEVRRGTLSLTSFANLGKAAVRAHQADLADGSKPTELWSAPIPASSRMKIRLLYKSRTVLEATVVAGTETVTHRVPYPRAGEYTGLGQLDLRMPELMARGGTARFRDLHVERRKAPGRGSADASGRSRPVKKPGAGK